MNSGQTVLNQDGKVEYYPNFIASEKSANYFQELREEIAWSKDELIMFGKRITMRRESAWFADGGKSYKYAGIKREGLTWSPRLESVKKRLEYFLKVKFNSCLANYYFDGGDGMGFHSDNEKMLDANHPIASISFGTDRIFQFQHKKTKLKKEVFLKDGSLLIMHPPCQEYWKHALPKTKDINNPRINLTFRKVLDS
jgi:alkylated DNA repair dioxygenase AlkB